MSPILVRPVREQFEHDRVIRVLQAKYKRKYEVAINPGAEQNASVGVGDLTMYPDLVLFGQERTRKIHGTIEVETTESINTLEAMAEWAPFSRLRTPFFLYVPANTIDTVRRLCADHGIDPAEIWTYHIALDQVRFTMVHRSSTAPKGSLPEHKPKPPAPIVVEDEIIEKPAAPKIAAVKTTAKAPAAKVATRAETAKSVKVAKPTKPANGARSAKPPAKAAAASKTPASAKTARAVKTARAAKSARPKLASAKQAAAKGAKTAKAAKSKPARSAKSR